MSRITINGHEFETSIPEADIRQRVKEIATQINHDMAGRNPLFLAVLNGAFIFAADLMREITIPCEISFVKLASYQGVISTGTVKEVIGLNVELTGRHVIIVEDIVDTGRTMRRMLDTLSLHKPASVSVCTLFHKPTKMVEDVKLDYVAFSIPDQFILGYGLDFDQQGRGLKDVYTIV